MQFSDFENDIVAGVVSHMKSEVSDEKKFVHRRAFVKKMFVAVSGAGAVHLLTAGGGQAAPESCGCNTAATNTCGAAGNLCVSENTCSSNTCSGFHGCSAGDECIGNTCDTNSCRGGGNFCNVDECRNDLCIVDTCAGNTCSTNQCTGEKNTCQHDTCGQDACAKDDECGVNHCEEFDIDCGMLDFSCRIKNTCSKD